ncbi:hypothetical protein E4U43_004013 [Claviceps pusilla]|uniref:Uncharacterized protein n=1 Tax=Claviceps pusilla TaxID=123648 RepID=A0A9P7N6G2_9HYPO|nr:hypothetical protein E4U43_004013 [Claviceps pusilla]
MSRRDPSPCYFCGQVNSATQSECLGCDSIEQTRNHQGSSYVRTFGAIINGNYVLVVIEPEPDTAKNGIPIPGATGRRRRARSSEDW